MTNDVQDEVQKLNDYDLNTEIEEALLNTGDPLLSRSISIFD